MELGAGDAVTRDQAARILAMHVASVDRLIRRGVLVRGRKYATAQLSRGQVEHLALTTRTVRQLIAGDYWIARSGAAAFLGRSEKRVQQLTVADRLPYVAHSANGLEAVPTTPARRHWQRTPGSVRRGQHQQPLVGPAGLEQPCLGLAPSRAVFKTLHRFCAPRIGRHVARPGQPVGQPGRSRGVKEGQAAAASSCSPTLPTTTDLSSPFHLAS